MADERVNVTVDDAHLARLHEVAADLGRRGMQVEAVLEGLGIVSGTAEDLAALREVEGVESVAAELEHDIGPPGSEVQGDDPTRPTG